MSLTSSSSCIIMITIISAISINIVSSARISASNYKKIFYDFEPGKELYLENPQDYMKPQLSKYYYRRFIKSPHLKYLVANYKPDDKPENSKAEVIKSPKDKELWEKPEVKDEETKEEKKSASSDERVVIDTITLSPSKHVLKSEPRLDWARKN